MRPTYAVLSKQALYHNIRWIREQAPQAPLIAMVKANAYGHGLRSVSLRIESQVEALGVATLDEALILRQCGIRKPIHSMQGFFDYDQLVFCDEHDIVPVVYRWDQLEMISAFVNRRQQGDKPFSIWIKVQTGLNRLGFLVESMPALEAWVVAHAEQVDSGWLTHWSCADTPSHPAHARQYEHVRHLWSRYPWARRSVNNSAGLLCAPEFNTAWIRVGAALYGIALPQAPIEAVMTLKSTVIQRRTLYPGETVGYGAHHQVLSISELAILTIGYGDGYPRQFLERGYVWVAGTLCPVIGKVSMDMMAIDVTTCPWVNVGDEVTLWGLDWSVNKVAEAAGLIPYQLVTGIHHRVRFLWSDELK